MRLAAGVEMATFRERQSHPLFRIATVPEDVMLALFAKLSAGDCPVRDLPVGTLSATTVVGVLAKMGLVELRSPEEDQVQ